MSRIEPKRVYIHIQRRGDRFTIENAFFDINTLSDILESNQEIYYKDTPQHMCMKMETMDIVTEILIGAPEGNNILYLYFSTEYNNDICLCLQMAQLFDVYGEVEKNLVETQEEDVLRDIYKFHFPSKTETREKMITDLLQCNISLKKFLLSTK